jgi:DNA recombination protein RmuC
MNDTIKKMSKLKITTSEGGPSIITAARNLLKAGARENKKKKPLADMDDTMFLEGDLTPNPSPKGEGDLKGEGSEV